MELTVERLSVCLTAQLVDPSDGCDAMGSMHLAISGSGNGFSANFSVASSEIIIVRRMLAIV